MGRARNKIRIYGGQLQRTDKSKIRKGKAIGRRVETAAEILGEVIVQGRPHLVSFSWGYPVGAGAADRRPVQRRSAVLSGVVPTVQGLQPGGRKAA